jgi:predicted GH43/DUF377 family glycosyl hydrolase
VKLKRFQGNPILSPNPANDWEDLAVFNPAAWYDKLGPGDMYMPEDG